MLFDNKNFIYNKQNCCCFTHNCQQPAPTAARRVPPGLPALRVKLVLLVHPA